MHFYSLITVTSVCMRFFFSVALTVFVFLFRRLFFFFKRMCKRLCLFSPSFSPLLDLIFFFFLATCLHWVLERTKYEWSKWLVLYVLLLYTFRIPPLGKENVAMLLFFFPVLKYTYRMHFFFFCFLQDFAASYVGGRGSRSFKEGGGGKHCLWTTLGYLRFLFVLSCGFRKKKRKKQEL